MEAGQALDHQARSRVGTKKKRRDRLIQRARAHPTWALGFGDEVWWSRLAQPNQHAWTEGDATYNQQVKRGAEGVRIVVCPLPSKSPWLNPIEPKWVHGKRAVSEPDRLQSAAELEVRVYDYYGGQHEEHLVMPKKVA